MALRSGFEEGRQNAASSIKSGGVSYPVVDCGKRRSTRLSSTALVATMKELADISRAEYCGPSTNPVDG